MNAPLSTKDTVSVLRKKYPDALVCIECGLLLATMKHSYGKSNLSEEQRRAYVCGECVWDQKQAAELLAIRRASIAKAREASRRPSRGLRTCLVDGKHRKGSPWFAERPERGDNNPLKPRSDSLHGPLSGGVLEDIDNTSVSRGVYIPSQSLSRRLGGRPKKHASAALAKRAARRAYRQRQRAALVPSGAA